MSKYLYSFNEGSRELKELLGDKGASLAEMTRIGLPVPFGFTITTDAHDMWQKNGEKIPQEIIEEIFEKLKELEDVVNKKIEGKDNPLLVSVRGGSVFSVSKNADTILNLGLNDTVVKALAKKMDNKAFAYITYMRFIQMFAETTQGINKQKFYAIIKEKIKERNVTTINELDIDDIKHIIDNFKILYKSEAKKAFPQHFEDQLLEAIDAIFKMTQNARGKTHTAVSIQEMVFGNLNDNSATGVAFTRNPKTGKKELFGEFLINAQGEDVIDKVRQTTNICELANTHKDTYFELLRIAELLEKHFREMQDIEFTIENEKLYILQTRDGSRTKKANLKIAVDMHNEDIIDKKTAIMRVSANDIEELFEQKKELTSLLSWADEIRDMKIRINADNVEDAKTGLTFGAEGIGLCRTEHMFFQKDRIKHMQEMLFATDDKARNEALEALLPYQKEDFKEIFRVMGEKPVTIRLLDPMLEDFLPNIKAFEKEDRFCRLSITYPQVANMQAKAIILAALEVKKENDIDVVAEIMLPMVSTLKEFSYVKRVIEKTIATICKKTGEEVQYQIGSMIETPRSALIADEIVREADFVSFGTNDLTQMVFGFTRKDMHEILPKYLKNGILKDDPFKILDQEGVGKLMQRAIKLLKKEKSNIKIGISGEQGGEASSIIYCHNIGINYISCAPQKVPTARLASAQAVIIENNDL